MALPKPVQQDLSLASFRTRTASKRFSCTIFGNDWDHFIEDWAPKCYEFVAQALGPYQKEPLPEIKAIEESYHAAGVNASFSPVTGQISLVPSVMLGKPGITLEKLTHELIHASLNDFPEGDPFYEESQVDYSVWLLAHAPFWGSHRDQMIEAAAFNIKCRRERAFKTGTDYDRKRWAGGVYASMAYGPFLIARLRQKKMEGDLTW
jgi:hypothetical protein